MMLQSYLLNDMSFKLLHHLHKSRATTSKMHSQWCPYSQSKIDTQNASKTLQATPQKECCQKRSSPVAFTQRFTHSKSHTPKPNSHKSQTKAVNSEDVGGHNISITFFYVFVVARFNFRQIMSSWFLLLLLRIVHFGCLSDKHA